MSDVRLVDEQLDETEDARHRRAQLVAHRRDEVVLLPVEVAQVLGRGALVLEGAQHRSVCPALLRDVDELRGEERLAVAARGASQVQLEVTPACGVELGGDLAAGGHAHGVDRVDER